jgi:hypothetical protein
MANQYTKKNAGEATPMDPAFGHLMPGPSNAELIAKQKELDELRAKLGIPKVELLADAHDKNVLDVGDLNKRNDPLQQLIRKYKKPHMALKLRSAKLMDHLGDCGYEIIKKQNGDLVKFGTMLLGEIPEEMAQEMRQTPIDEANEQIRNVNNSQREAIERLRAEAGSMGLSLIEPGQTVTDHVTGRDVKMGVSVERITSE